ncbi:MAG: VacJ family lipoprotein [Gammaproteobacteria bacterium]|nr:VacJ family lipoprotein [Gammaproteobacteria bacterium]
MKKLVPLTLTVLASTLLSGCVTVNPATKIPQDPYESYNRGMFQFNQDFNNTFLQPITNVYDQAPSSARSGVRNFFNNIYTVGDIGNDLMQANFSYAGRDTARLFINTFIGFFGMHDVASQMGIQPHQQSFGMTLAKWGMVNSSYFIIPFFGPSTVTGLFGMVPDYFMNPVTYVKPNGLAYGMRGLSTVQIASDSLPKQRFIMSMALDPYVAIRNAYLQNREFVVQQIQSDGLSSGQDQVAPGSSLPMVPPEAPVKQKNAAPGRV